MADSMFELLMGLPLFRGASHERLSQVVGAAHFHFLKYPAGEAIVHSGQECSHLTFIIGGQARMRVANSSGRFDVSSTLHAPAVLAPDFLFGRVTRYPCSVTALSSCSILQIDKAEFIGILRSDEVFLLNFLNTLSVSGQKARLGLLSLTSGALDERIAFWVLALSQPGATDIVMNCATRDLCSLFNVSRSMFDSVATAMQQKGLITFTNRSIKVVDRKAMADLLENPEESHEDYPIIN